MAGLLDRLATRALDLTLAGVGLALTGPALPLVALAIRLESPGPALFKHPRLGLGGKKIVITKFRTMHVGAPEQFNPDGSRREVKGGDARLTRVGRFLRGGLDELPQLFLVLRGDLAMVGPRPDDLYAVDLYRHPEWLKLSVKPGLTGLAAVNGRNDIPWKERLRYDVYYARHRDVWMDVRIVMKTIAIALGLSRPGGVVAQEAVERFFASTEAQAAARALEREVRATRAREERRV